MSPIKIKHTSLSKTVSFITFAGLILVFAGYALFQARLLITGPQVTLDKEIPANQTAQKITLSGQANNITQITLNGRNIETSEDGHFEEPLILENGYTIASIRAEDRYGREVVLEREFVYTPFSLIQ